MANEQNLRPSEYKFTKDDASRGGKKSGEVRRQRRLMRDILEDMLKKTYTNSQGKQVDGATLICLKQFQSAVDGDLKAFTEIRDMVGEQPVQRIEIDTIDPRARAEMDELLGLND